MTESEVGLFLQSIHTFGFQEETVDEFVKRMAGRAENAKEEEEAKP